MDVESVVSKFKNCRDRDELTRQIKYYKDLALQSATNLDLAMATHYTKVAQRLQEMCDKLPVSGRLIARPSPGEVPVKTANISDKERARIKAEWEKKAKK